MRVGDRSAAEAEGILWAGDRSAAEAEGIL
jgi:hypothetical protein